MTNQEDSHHADEDRGQVVFHASSDGGRATDAVRLFSRLTGGLAL